jgi:hypothetical protein
MRQQQQHIGNQRRQHKLKNKKTYDVEVGEVSWPVLGGRRRQVKDANDVVVAKHAQELDLAQDALRVRQVFERALDLLDGHSLASHLSHVVFFEILFVWLFKSHIATFHRPQSRMIVYVWHESGS